MPDYEDYADTSAIESCVDEVARQLRLVFSVCESAARHAATRKGCERRGREDYQHPRAEDVPPPTVDDYAGTSEDAVVGAFRRCR